MTDKSRISIAMAVYNGELFIREQLESFLRQTRLPDELVVSDNCSTDSTLDIVREFAAGAPFAVQLLINERNLGVRKNFERAISACSGDLIFLSDCDDVWYANKIDVMEQALRRWPAAAIAVCNADIVDEDLRRLGSTVWGAGHFSPNRRLRRNLTDGKGFRRTVPAPANCMAFRGRFKSLVLPLPDDFFGRFIASTIVYSGAGGVALLTEALLAYRQHPGQVTRRAGISVGANRTKVGLRSDRFAARKERPLKTLSPLMERLEQINDSSYSNRAIRTAALCHWHARCELPKNRIARLPVVLTELMTLRYHRFSSGFLTALKDLLFVE
jgi:glycosyltransferase involved in cell wall biosynthesis